MSEERAVEKRIRKQNCTVVKRKVHKFETASETFIYISKASALHSTLKKVRKALIQKTLPKITLCGLGAAVTRTCMLALQIQGMLGGPAVCDLCIRTGTVELIDEIVPHDPDKDYETQVRRNSKIEVDLVAVRKQA